MGECFFSAFDGVHGHELWKSDGSEEGTVIVKDIVPRGSSVPAYFTGVNGTVFFQAYGGLQIGTELWRTDGTARGIALVKNIAATSGDWSTPTALIAVNDMLFFGADDGIHGVELWKVERLKNMPRTLLLLLDDLTPD